MQYPNISYLSIFVVFLLRRLYKRSSHIKVISAWLCSQTSVEILQYPIKLQRKSYSSITFRITLELLFDLPILILAYFLFKIFILIFTNHTFSCFTIFQRAYICSAFSQFSINWKLLIKVFLKSNFVIAENGM